MYEVSCSRNCKYISSCIYLLPNTFSFTQRRNDQYLVNSTVYFRVTGMPYRIKPHTLPQQSNSVSIEVCGFRCGCMCTSVFEGRRKGTGKGTGNWGLGNGNGNGNMGLSWINTWKGQMCLTLNSKVRWIMGLSEVRSTFLTCFLGSRLLSFNT